MKNILKQEKVILEELNQIIKEMGVEIYFNYGGPAEQNVCLEKINNMWVVYFVERDMKNQEKEYESLYGACIKVIDFLAYSNEISEYYTEKIGRVLRK